MAQNIEARGGAAAVKAMQSLKIQGKLIIQDGQFELQYVQTVRRPASIRTEATIQGLTQVQAFDGTTGWQINPFQGRKDPERLSADDIKSLAETVADFDGALVDAQKKGNKLDYLGTEDIDGTPAHKIKLTRPSGDTEYVYLDPDHFLEIRLLSQRTEHGVQVETETDLGDYEKIDGVFIPFSGLLERRLQVPELVEEVLVHALDHVGAGVHSLERRLAQVDRGLRGLGHDLHLVGERRVAGPGVAGALDELGEPGLDHLLGTGVLGDVARDGCAGGAERFGRGDCGLGLGDDCH